MNAQQGVLSSRFIGLFAVVAVVFFVSVPLSLAESISPPPPQNGGGGGGGSGTNLDAVSFDGKTSAAPPSNLTENSGITLTDSNGGSGPAGNISANPPNDGFGVIGYSYSGKWNANPNPVTSYDIQWTVSEGFIVKNPVETSLAINGAIPTFTVTGGTGTLTISAFIISTENVGSVASPPFSVANGHSISPQWEKDSVVMLTAGSSYTLTMLVDLQITTAAATGSFNVDPPPDSTDYGASVDPVPEPSSLLLASLGICTLAGAAGRRRLRARRARPAL